MTEGMDLTRRIIFCTKGPELSANFDILNRCQPKSIKLKLEHKKEHSQLKVIAASSKIKADLEVTDVVWRQHRHFEKL